MVDGGKVVMRPITKAEARRLLQAGGTYDVTNHYINRPDHPCFGTVRRTIGLVNTASFGWAGSDERLSFASFTFGLDSDGSLLVLGHPSTDVLFLTLTPVVDSAAGCAVLCAICGDSIVDGLDVYSYDVESGGPTHGDCQGQAGVMGNDDLEQRYRGIADELDAAVSTVNRLRSERTEVIRALRGNGWTLGQLRMLTGLDRAQLSRMTRDDPGG